MQPKPDLQERIALVSKGRGVRARPLGHFTRSYSFSRNVVSLLISAKSCSFCRRPLVDYFAGARYGRIEEAFDRNPAPARSACGRLLFISGSLHFIAAMTPDQQFCDRFY